MKRDFGMQKVTKTLLSFSLILALASAGAVAQTFPNGQGPSSPGPPRGLSKTGYLTYEAQSTSRYSQAAALSQIASILGNKSHPPNKADRGAVLQALPDIALSGTTDPAISGTAVINNFPMIRMKASHLIGEIGGSKAEVVLLHILKSDRNAMVLAETAFQLGQIDRNPNNSVSDAIANALMKNISPAQDKVFAYSALLSLKKLAKSGPRKPDPTVFQAVSFIQKLGYGYAVNKSAAAAMKSLITYG